MSEEKSPTTSSNPPIQKRADGSACLSEPVKTGAVVGVAAYGGVSTYLASLVNPVLAVIVGVSTLFGVKKVSDVPSCETPVKAPEPLPANTSCPKSAPCDLDSLPKFPSSDEKTPDRPPPLILPPLSLSQKKSGGSMLG